MLALCVPSMACGQAATLPSGIQEVADLSSAQKAQIREYIRAGQTMLQSEDLLSRRSGRDRLLEMFDGSSISVAFRIESSEALMPEVRRLIASQRDWDRFAGYRLAAKVASEESAILFESAISTPSKADRLMALGQLRVLFLEVRKTDNPAVYPETLVQLSRTLGRSLTEETDADVTLYQVRALRTLAEAGSPRIAAAQRSALVEMCNAVAARVSRQQASNFRGADEAMIELLMYLEAADAVRGIVAAGLTQVDEASMRSIGGLMGQTLALVSRTYQDVPRDGASRRHLERLTQRSVEVLRVLVGQHNERSPQHRIDESTIATPDGLTRRLTDGNMAEFRLAVLRIVGEGGVLTRQPFGHAASHFKVQ